MTDEKPSLAALRAEIDEIDDRLHDLIMQRSTIIERVRHAKVNDRIKIRPAREADILYRLSDRHHGVFPKQSLFRMWREMIVGTLALETPFSVAVLTVPDDHGYEDLARDHFGSFSNLQCREATQEVLNLVANDKVTVGVLPHPEGPSSDTWWQALLSFGEDRPWIMGRLPFFGRSNAKGAGLDALAISGVEPEPSERDVSIYSLSSTRDVIPPLLEEGLSIVRTFACPSSESAETRYYVELAGFVRPEDSRIAKAANAIDWLGVYSLPIDDDELKVVRAPAP